MYRKIPVADMSRQEWLNLRRTGIGGSEAGAVCGLNPYSSPLKVYRDKTEPLPPQEADNEAVRQGHDLEDYVARRFMEATGLKVRRSNYMYRSVENPFMIADVDRLVTGEDAGLECKTAGAYSADKWKDGDIPLHYVMQCYHYMAVTGKRVWYIAAVILGQEFVYRRLEWDDALIGKLIEMERRFWTGYVEKGILPAPDGSASCDAVLAQYFPDARKNSAIRLEGFDEKLARREGILWQIAGLQKEQARIEQEIKLYMEGNETAESGDYRVTWSNVESTRLDTRRLRQEKPEIYQTYAKVSTSRRFQIKAVEKRAGKEGAAYGGEHDTAA